MMNFSIYGKPVPNHQPHIYIGSNFIIQLKNWWNGYYAIDYKCDGGFLKKCWNALY